MKQFVRGFCIISMLIFIACNNKQQKNDLQGAKIDSVKISENPYVNMDQSPMDMSWYPINYPIEKMKGNDTLKLIAKLIYSRPHKKGRILFGTTDQSLCQYGTPWRLGANEATQIEFFENVNIAGKNVAKGTYVLYCIPNADRWTIILNTNLNTWGLHINEAMDVLKTDVPVLQQIPAVEDFTMLFEDNATGANLIMAWDNVKTVLPIVFAK